MSQFQKELKFDRRILIVGFGCVGQGVLPLLLRHIELRPDQISILTADDDGRGIAREYGVSFTAMPLTPENFRGLLELRLGPGDFLLNMSVDVASIALIDWCQRNGVLYLDTCIEPWAGGHVDGSVAVGQRSNYALREAALGLRHSSPKGPTAVLTHGANPGLVSYFTKQALLNLAADAGRAVREPARREEWAQLACDLGVKVIHVSERDTQVDRERKQTGEFVNTWSVDAFVGEGCQPAELGWGSHERQLPPDGHRHDSGSRSAIYLNRPGASTWVRTWTPLAGPIQGLLITHGESISMSDYLTLGEGDHPRYRPTVHYAYHPCDDAVLSINELAGRNWQLQTKTRILKDGITTGIDELGVLLMGHTRGAYWYGSRLSVEEARALVPHNSATSLQVTATVLAGVVWAIENPREGIVEPDEIEFRRILGIALPYVGNVVGVYSDWTPLQGRGRLFEEDIDADDPWQFKNFLVT